MRLKLVLVSVLVLVGCGGPPDDPTDGAVSGIRLKIRHWQLGDTRVLDAVVSGPRFYDSARDESCTPTSWSNGGVYCTPHDENGTLRVVYADAACTQPVAQAESICQRTSTLAEIDGADRRLGHLFRVGAARDATQYYVHAGLGGAECAGPYDIGPASPVRLFDLGAEITTGDLVPMTVGAAHGTGRIRQRDWETPDGARAPWGTYDQALGGDCYVEMDHDGTRATMRPDAYEDVTTSNYFRDAACTHQVVEVPVDRDPPPILAQQPDQCQLPTYFAPGPEATTQLYSGDAGGGGCVATPHPTTSRFFALGDAIELAVLARGPRDVDARIQPMYMTGDDISIRVNPAVFDSNRGTECDVLPFADGTSRCLSAALEVISLYADAACQTLIQVAEHDDFTATCSGGVAPPPLAYASTPADSCGFAVAKVFRIGPERDQVYNLGTTGCQPYTGRYQSVDATFYDLADEVPASDFAEAMLVTD
jgi:hypothetical protein